MTTTVYHAKRILTMNPSRPEATHVAVRDGRILAVGDLAELEGWGAYTLDTRFESKILMPGLVEGHSHTMEGVFWRYVYCGYFDRMDPNGHMWPGVGSIDEVVTRLQDALAAREETGALSGWGLDPIYYGARRCIREDLDRVSTEVPVGVLHASGHIMNVNTAAL